MGEQPSLTESSLAEYELAMAEAGDPMPPMRRDRKASQKSRTSQTGTRSAAPSRKGSRRDDASAPTAPQGRRSRKESAEPGKEVLAGSISITSPVSLTERTPSRRGRPHREPWRNRVPVDRDAPATPKHTGRYAGRARGGARASFGNDARGSSTSTGMTGHGGRTDPPDGFVANVVLDDDASARSGYFDGGGSGLEDGLPAGATASAMSMSQRSQRSQRTQRTQQPNAPHALEDQHGGSRASNTSALQTPAHSGRPGTSVGMGLTGTLGTTGATKRPHTSADSRRSSRASTSSQSTTYRMLQAVEIKKKHPTFGKYLIDSQQRKKIVDPRPYVFGSSTSRGLFKMPSEMDRHRGPGLYGEGSPSMAELAMDGRKSHFMASTTKRLDILTRFMTARDPPPGMWSEKWHKEQWSKCRSTDLGAGKVRNCFEASLAWRISPYAKFSYPGVEDPDGPNSIKDLLRHTSVRYGNVGSKAKRFVVPEPMYSEPIGPGDFDLSATNGVKVQDPKRPSSVFASKRARADAPPKPSFVGGDWGFSLLDEMNAWTANDKGQLPRAPRMPDPVEV